MKSSKSVYDEFVVKAQAERSAYIEYHDHLGVYLNVGFVKPTQIEFASSFFIRAGKCYGITTLAKYVATKTGRKTSELGIVDQLEAWCKKNDCELVMWTPSIQNGKAMTIAKMVRKSSN